MSSGPHFGLVDILPVWLTEKLQLNYSRFDRQLPLSNLCDEYRHFVACHLLGNKSKYIKKVTLANLHSVMYDVDPISPAFYYHFHRLHVDFVSCLSVHTFPCRDERQFVFASGVPIIIIHRECIRVWPASSKC